MRDTGGPMAAPAGPRAKPQLPPQPPFPVSAGSALPQSADEPQSLAGKKTSLSCLRGSRVRQAGLNATWEMRTQRWLPSWASLSSPALREASSSVMRTYSSPWGGPGGEEYRPANDHIVSSEVGSSATQATTASPATA